MRDKYLGGFDKSVKWMGYMLFSRNAGDQERASSQVEESDLTGRNFLLQGILSMRKLPKKKIQ